MCAHMHPEARTAKLAPLTRLALQLITRAHTNIAAQVCEPKRTWGPIPNPGGPKMLLRRKQKENPKSQKTKGDRSN